MHDALAIGIPTLAVFFGAFLNNARLGDVNTRLGDVNMRVSDMRADLNSFRAEHRIDLREVRDKLEVLGERVAKLEAHRETTSSAA